MTEVNFNGRDADYEGDYLCSNPACDTGGQTKLEDDYGDCGGGAFCGDDCGNGWQPWSLFLPLPGQTETIEEAVERIVREQLKELTKRVDPIYTPIIEKYHLKHK